MLSGIQSGLEVLYFRTRCPRVSSAEPKVALDGAVALEPLPRTRRTV